MWAGRIVFFSVSISFFSFHCLFARVTTAKVRVYNTLRNRFRCVSLSIIKKTNLRIRTTNAQCVRTALCEDYSAQSLEKEDSLWLRNHCLVVNKNGGRRICYKTKRRKRRRCHQTKEEGKQYTILRIRAASYNLYALIVNMNGHVSSNAAHNTDTNLGTNCVSDADSILYWSVFAYSFRFYSFNNLHSHS